jgi:uncharacterized protein (PEP-CTERM system associated)
VKCCRVADPRSLLIASAVAGSTVIAVFPVSAAKWRVTPRIEAEVSYTDNVDLDRPGKESDVVFRVNPGLALKADGHRMKLQADFEGSFLQFARDGRREWRNHLRSKLYLEPIEDHLFIEATGIVAEPFVDNTGSVTFSSSNFSINRRQTQSYTLEPYFKHRLFDIADMRWTYRLRYVTVSQPKPDDPTPRFIANYLSHTGQVTADSGDRYGRLHWTLRGSYDDRTRGDGRRSREVIAEADAEYRVVRWLGVLASAGWEKIEDPDLSANIDDFIWSAGLRFNPTRNTDVSLRYGKFDGDTSFSAEALYRRKRFKIGLSYRHEVTTTQRRFADINEDGQFNDFDYFVSDFGSLLDPDDIVFGIENDTFRSNRLEVNVAYEHRRTSFDARAYYEERVFDTTGREVREYDIKTRLSRRLNERLRAVLHLRHRHTDFDLGPSRVDNFYGVRAELHYDFSKYAHGTLAYVFSTLDSNVSVRDQTENVVQLSLRANF